MNRNKQEQTQVLSEDNSVTCCEIWFCWVMSPGCLPILPHIIETSIHQRGLSGKCIINPPSEILSEACLRRADVFLSLLEVRTPESDIPLGVCEIRRVFLEGNLMNGPRGISS